MQTVFFFFRSFIKTQSGTISALRKIKNFNNFNLFSINILQPPSVSLCITVFRTRKDGKGGVPFRNKTGNGVIYKKKLVIFALGYCVLPGVPNHFLLMATHALIRV